MTGGGESPFFILGHGRMEGERGPATCGFPGPRTGFLFIKLDCHSQDSRAVMEVRLCHRQNLGTWDVAHVETEGQMGLLEAVET